MARFRQVAVWPGSLRIVHWVNAFAVLIQIPLGLFILSGGYLDLTEKAEEALMNVHGAVGIVFSAGVAARIALLFIGPPAARWGDVVPHTKEQFALFWATIRYYLSGFRGRAPLYLSHNPLAGLFDLVLFTAFFTQAATGLNMFFFHGEEHEHANGAEHAHGAALWPPEWFESVHVAGAIIIVLFVIAHFAALGAHDLAERRGLLSSMVSGKKFYSEDELEELVGQMSSKGLKAEDDRPV